MTRSGNVYLGLVHRLDRPVSGVMVYAKTSKAASRLSEQIRNKTFQKEYLAIVNGKFDKTTGTFKDYLWKDEKKNISFVVKSTKKNAKQAILDYKVLDYNKEENISLVKINLKTGRHHQIRVQFSSRGHSLYGDRKYHGRCKNSNSVCLFAYKICFNHPTTKEKLEFSALPEQTKIWKIFSNTLDSIKY